MLTVAYLGPELTYTHLAAKEKFGEDVRYLHAPTIKEVFELVRRKDANYGVVPIENSVAGGVADTLDTFINLRDSEIRIHGEIDRPIRHSFIMHEEALIEEIRLVFSHPQALMQSEEWLRKNLSKEVRLWETNSTSEAVLLLMPPQGAIVSTSREYGDLLRGSARTHAAIASDMLVKGIKGLKAISLPENPNNRTRFLIIGFGEAKKGRSNKTSILFGIKDHPGALYDALVPFKYNRINLTKIESRPSKKKVWEYLFFIDLEGHVSESRIKKALDALKRSASFVEVLGS